MLLKLKKAKDRQSVLIQQPVQQEKFRLEVQEKQNQKLKQEIMLNNERRHLEDSEQAREEK